MLLVLIATLTLGATTALAQLNLSLAGKLSYAYELSDVWGWEHPITHKQYALVGTQAGVSIVDVSIPTTPTEVAFITGVFNDWRDINTYKNYAYVVSEGGDGLKILNLLDLPATPTVTTWTGDSPLNFSSAHTIFIDEKGYGYLFGFKRTGISTSTNQRGAIIIDIAANPTNPTYKNTYSNGYIHDGFVQNDTLWAAQVYTGILKAIDVSEINNLQDLGSVSTPNSFTHSAQPSGKYVFTTDEDPYAFVTTYSTADITDMQQVSQYATDATGTIPHNLYLDSCFLTTSYYTKGVTIADATYPYNLIEVGNYDTSPYTGNGYNGAWSAYPFFKNLMLVADIENGLFVLNKTYTKAAYLQGKITNATNNNALSGATITIQGATNANGNATSQASTGFYATGNALAGTFNVQYSKAGFVTQTIQTQLINGQLTTQDVALLPCTSISSGITPSPAPIICAPDSVLLSALTPANGFTYQWLLNGTNISNATNSFLYAKNGGNYTLKVSANGCTNTVTSLPVAVAKKNKPTPNITPNITANICGNDTVIYSTPFVTGNTYIWTVTNGTIITGQNTNTVTVKWNENAQNGSITVQQKN